jgi:membrane-anchored protein YejM (alkaline phosphatase superfamily)
MIRFFLLAAFLAVSACKKSDTDYSDFALVYVELKIAQKEYEETENSKIVRFQILQRYGLSADDFEKKIEKIKKEPERWLEFQNTLIKILDSIAISSKSEEKN